MPTAQRLLLEGEVLPTFAALFSPSALVLNLGAGDYPYREYFACQYRTVDQKPGLADETFSVERIPYADGSVDGVVFMGVFERLDDPLQAMREIRRILRPGGYLLFGAPGLAFPWKALRDRWRLTPGGLAVILAPFQSIQRYELGAVYHLAIVRRVETVF